MRIHGLACSSRGREKEHGGRSRPGVALAVAALIVLSGVRAAIERSVYAGGDVEPRYWGAYVIRWGMPFIGAFACGVTIFVIFRFKGLKVGTSLDYSGPSALENAVSRILDSESFLTVGAHCGRGRKISDTAGFHPLHASQH